MSFKLIAKIADINGLDLVMKTSEMISTFPGENVLICPKILHNYYKGCKLSIFTPQHYFNKFKLLWPGKKGTALEKILSSVSGNTHFVLIHAASIKDTNEHQLYMRSL